MLWIRCDVEKPNDACSIFSCGNRRYCVYVFFVDDDHLEMVTGDDFSCACYPVPAPLMVNVTEVFACCASSPCLYSSCHHRYHPYDACPDASLSLRYVLYLSVCPVPFGYPNCVYHNRVFPLSSSTRQQQLLLHEPSALFVPARLSPSLFPVRPALAP